MKNLAIIGASYLQLPLIEKAKEMGFRTHVFAWAANDVGESAADCFYPISVIEKERIAKKCREIGIQGVCSIASDLCSVTVNYVANELGLPGNSPECSAKSSNKYLMRRAFEVGGDPIPRYALVDQYSRLEELKLDYPVIVKPTDRSGSRGVCLIESQNDLQEAVDLAIAQGFEKKVLIEEFIEGQEYSVEGISYHGKHRLMAVTLKHTTGAPNFIETGHMEPASIDDQTRHKIYEIVAHALDSLGIRDSASHSEIKITPDGKIYIIEIGARMGGDCIGSDLVTFSTGIDYVQSVIQVACGQEPDLSVKRKTTPVEIRYLFSEADVRRMEAEKHSKHFVRVVEYHPENIGKTTDSSNRAGCYIVTL